MKGHILALQRYSLHDGPGIRTMVFLKGCPLRCQWCANPESQEIGGQIGYKSSLCIGGECLLCQRVCPERAIFYPGGGQVEIHHDKCTNCLKCSEICPAKAITTYGQWLEVEEVLDNVAQDGVFYARSGGGLTISGGEPLLQGEFTLALLKAAKARHYHTALETCGYGPWEQMAAIIPYVDWIFYDLKLLDSAWHSAYTGVDNALILANFKRLQATYPEKSITVRTPIIPGVNDNEAEIRAIKNFVSEYPATKYELLKYHGFGQSKYQSLGRNYPLGEQALDEETFNRLVALVND